MRWFGLFILLSFMAFGCSASRGGDTETAPVEPPPPPPPQPRAEPQVWDNEPSYSLGWPINVRIGVLNTGETVVNVPDGEFFGVSMRARRIDQTPEPPPEDAVETAVEAIAPQEGAETPTATEGAPAEGSATPSEGAAAGGVTPEAEPVEPAPEPEIPAIECESITVGAPSGGLFPLATGSSAYRSVLIDQLCPLDEPGRYVVEIIVEVPEVEGGDISGRLDPVNVPISITLPDPPIVARLNAERIYSLGQPIEATVRVTNYGESQVFMITNRGIQVRLQAESNGEAVPCSDPGRARGARGRLRSGESREAMVNIADRCQLGLVGTYTITPQIVVPRAGARSISGEFDAAPITIQIVEGE